MFIEVRLHPMKPVSPFLHFLLSYGTETLKNNSTFPTLQSFRSTTQMISLIHFLHFSRFVIKSQPHISSILQIKKSYLLAITQPNILF